MTMGEFWTNVTTLCLVYNGRVTSGVRSALHNRMVGGHPTSFHLLGMAADVVLNDWNDTHAFKVSANRLKILVIDEREDKNHLHLQPQ